MSAEPDTRDDHAAALAAMNREADRCTLTIRPLLPVAPRQVWDMDSYALPVPRRAYDYVRDAANWRLVIHAAIEHYTTTAISATRRKALLPEYRRFMRALMLLGPDHDLVALLVERLFPPARCGNATCGNWFYGYNKRVLYCSDECCRAVETQLLLARPNGRTCAMCGEPLRGRQRRCCSMRCARLAQRKGGAE